MTLPTDAPPWLHQEIQDMRRRVRTYIQTGRLPTNPHTSPTGPLEPVTETCTCHCWHNHRNQPGICTAASTPGTTINGQPACPACHKAT